MKGLLAALLCWGGSASAQEGRAMVHFPLRLADLTVASDTVSGLAVLMQPAVTSRQGKTQAGLVWLHFHPDTALEWINSAVSAIRLSASPDAAEGIQWSRTLLPVRGRGAIALGRSRKKGALQKTHWLAISDSATGWRIEMTGREADSLLRLFLVLGSRSRLDTTDLAPADSGRVDREVDIIEQRTPRFSPARGTPYGRVVAQYVVDEQGRVEPGSFVAFLASDPALIAEVRRVLPDWRFRPAERGGRPVRQLVRQVFAFLPGPAP